MWRDPWQGVAIMGREDGEGGCGCDVTSVRGWPLWAERMVRVAVVVT